MRIKKGEKELLFLVLGLLFGIFLISFVSAATAISTCQELQNIKNDITIINGYQAIAGDYYLTQDIDCSATKTWNGGLGFEPFGIYLSPAYRYFKGTFDGKGHLIRNLYINRPGPTYHVWGLFGSMQYAKIMNLGLKNVDITGPGAAAIGWDAYGSEINQVFSTGKITASTGRAGGLLGAARNTKIINCYSQANVSTSIDAGGLIGAIYDISQASSITNTYSTGKINGNPKGGLIAFNYNNIGSISSSYWDTQTSGISTSAGGTGKNTVDMKKQATFVNWDFADVWQIQENIDYPRFKWESPCVPESVSVTCGTWVCGEKINNCGMTVSCPPGCQTGENCVNGVCQTIVSCGDGICSAPTEDCNNCPADCECPLVHSCQSPNDIILKLYQPTNSHGALWNDANYKWDICYSEIFGFNYNGANPHQCTSSNKVVGLFSTANSHGEIPSLNNYLEKVCYSDLDCEKKTTQAQCDSFGGKVVVRLLSDTDSHISDAGDNSYNVLICCKEKGILDSVWWANMNNELIDHAEKNDRVKLIFQGSLNGNNVDYEIWKRGLINSRILSGSTNKTYATWKPSEDGTYYFVAQIHLQAGIKMSGDLIVSDENNSPPVANIDTPKYNEVYNKNTDINFNQTSYDFDDFMNYSWNFNDGNITSGSTEDYKNYNLTHKYNNIGQRNINLNVIDERGLSDSDMTSILIIDGSIAGKYVFAGIKAPRWNENINANPYEFDGGGSFAIEVIPGSPVVIKCLGGACPAQTSDIPPIPIDPNGKLGNFNDLNFTWEFDDGTVFKKKGIEKYRKTFGTLGWHLANLNITLNPSGEKGFTYVKFKLNALPSEKCRSAGNVWWEDGVQWSTLEANGKCLGDDISAGTGDDCCPASYECKEDPANPSALDKYFCQIGAICDVTSCSQYLTQQECIDDVCKAGENGAGSEGCGVTKTTDVCNIESSVVKSEDCKCEWDSALNSCKLKGKMSVVINNIALEGSCITGNIQTGECIEGAMSVSQESFIEWLSGISDLQQWLNSIGYLESPEKWIGDNCNGLNDMCFSGTKVISCGEETIKLKFFTWVNALIAIILVAIIYFFWFSLKKKKIRKNKNF